MNSILSEATEIENLDNRLQRVIRAAQQAKSTLGKGLENIWWNHDTPYEVIKERLDAAINDPANTTYVSLF